MYYISRVKLDARKRKTAAALRNRGVLHVAIENSVSGDRPHNMWRIEPDMSLLIVSRDIPYLGDIQEQFGDAHTKPVTKAYDGHIDSIKKGNILRFKIEVNPVICSRKDGRKNGKDIPLNLRRTSNHPFCAEDWMKKKLEENGMEVISILDIGHDTACFIKDEKIIPIFTVTYAGVLRVEDEDAAKRAITTGIGGKKTYGCGMLTVMQAVC